MTTARKASQPAPFAGVVDIVYSPDERAWFGLRHTDYAVTTYHESRATLRDTLADGTVVWLGASDSDL